MIIPEMNSTALISKQMHYICTGICALVQVFFDLQMFHENKFSLVFMKSMVSSFINFQSKTCCSYRPKVSLLRTKSTIKINEEIFLILSVNEINWIFLRISYHTNWKYLQAILRLRRFFNEIFLVSYQNHNESSHQWLHFLYGERNFVT